MTYAYIQLHAPEPPRRPHTSTTDAERDRNNPYPDFEQSYVVEEAEDRDDTHVVVIDL